MSATRFGHGVADGDVETLTASRTLTEADNGKTFISGAADVVVTLPITKEGLHFRFLTSTLSATTGYSVSPQAVDRIQGKGITAADDKDIINSAASDAVGDLLEIVGDGSAGWWIVGMLGTWAREA